MSWTRIFWSVQRDTKVMGNEESERHLTENIPFGFVVTPLCHDGRCTGVDEREEVGGIQQHALQVQSERLPDVDYKLFLNVVDVFLFNVVHGIPEALPLQRSGGRWEQGADNRPGIPLAHGPLACRRYTPIDGGQGEILSHSQSIAFSPLLWHVVVDKVSQTREFSLQILETGTISTWPSSANVQQT